MTWTFVAALSQSGMTALLAAGGELVACTAAGEIAASADGIAWTWRGTIDQLRVQALASDEPNPTAVGFPEAPTAVAFAPRPNPARGDAWFSFDLARAAVVTVRVVDLAGREVARPLAGEILPAGRSNRAWRPERLPNGVYLLRATIGGREEARRWVWLGSR